MKKRIKSIDIKSTAEVAGAIYAVLGLVIGAIFTIVTLIAGPIEEGASDMEQLLFGPLAVVFLTILYGIMGYVGGAIVAWVYNKVVKRVGGLKIEFEDVE